MKLLGCMIAGAFIVSLLFLGSIGAYVFAIICLGVIFRCLFYLKDLHHVIVPEGEIDRVKEAYNNHMKERNERMS